MRRAFLKLLVILFLFSSFNCYSQEEKISIDSLQLSINLSNAILENDTLAFDSIIATKIDVNIPAYNGVTPIMYAAQEGNLYFIEKLLALGANVNQVPDNKVTALQSAVVGNNLKVVKLLLENGAGIYTTDNWGKSPVLSAAQSNNIEMVQLLINADAALDDRDADGNTALHYAAALGNDSLLVFLIEAGAKLNIKERQGFSPLMVATSQNFNSTAEIFVSYGANLNIVNDEGFSALTIAILNGNSYLAELFLLNGADGNIIEGKAKDHWYFSKGTGKYMRKILRNSNVKRNILPVFEDWAGGMKFGVTEKHFTTAILLGVREKKYNLWFEANFGLTPFVFSSLTELNQKQYQFWERNYWGSLEGDKYFSLFNNYKTTWGIFTGAEAGFKIGSYRGTKFKPPSEFYVLPTAGLYWRQDLTEIRVGYKKGVLHKRYKPCIVEVQFHFYFGRS